MRDDLGRDVPVPARVRRVVSLVPSLTEAVAATAEGLLVGATNWCTHPAGLDVARVRGTKNPDLAAVVGLDPDLVLANAEENREQDLDALRAAGLPVWVTDVRTVTGAIRSLDRMLGACGLGRPGWLAQAHDAWVATGEPPESPFRASTRTRAFVPIWRKPWMSLGRDTFAGDVLAHLGIEHVYDADESRYPRVSLEDVLRRRPDLVVCPDEPYAFDAAEDLDCFAGWDVPVAFVSGRHLTWYGPSLSDAPRVLREQLAAAVHAPPAAPGRPR